RLGVDQLGLVRDDADPVIAEIDAGVEHVAPGAATGVVEGLGDGDLTLAALHALLDDPQLLLGAVEVVEAADPLELGGVPLLARRPLGGLGGGTGLGEAGPHRAVIDELTDVEVEAVEAVVALL